PQRIARRTDDKRHLRPGVPPGIWDVDLVLDGAAQTALFDVAGHADDGPPRRRRVPPVTNAPAERALPRPVMTRHGLVDDDDGIPALILRLREPAPFPQREAE